MRKKLLLVLNIITLSVGVTGCQSNHTENETVKSEEETVNKGMEEFAGKKFSGGDGSVICFKEDESFAWYQSEDCQDDNYYSGTYEIYLAEDAVDYIVNDLPEYGITREELDNYFALNQEDDFYKMENYCCMVLHNDVIKIDGEVMNLEANTSYYMGFYADGYYDAANMQTGNYSLFTVVASES